MKRLIFLLLPVICTQSFGQPENFAGLKPVNGTELFLKTTGTGEPILFIHGGPGLSHDYFFPHMEHLASRFSLVFYDQRGCGRSSLALEKEDVSLDHFVNDISGILDALAIERVHIFGHSFGGLLAMKFATTYPQKVKSLILCNSVAASKEFDQLGKEKQLAALTPQDKLDRSTIFASEAFKNRSPEAYEQLFKISFKRAFYDTLRIEELDLHLHDNFSKSAEVLFGLSADLVAYDYHSALARLSVPALIIHGAADLVPIEASRKLSETIPGARFVVMEKSGHFPFIEERQEFSRVLSSFLESTAQH